MAQESYFWEGDSTMGDTGHVGPYGRSVMSALLNAIWGKTGVLSGLAVVPSSPAGQSVVVEAGTGVIQGQFYHLDADTTLSIDDNTSGHARIDYVVLECDWAAKTITAKVVEGTPGAAPSAPTLTQTAGTLWQMPLAQVAVADSFTSITDTEITRERTWARDDWPGKMIASAHDSEPEGWLICDGRAISRTDYRDLFDAIGTTWGSGDGSSTFNLPDLRGRVLAGMDDFGTVQGAANVITDASADSLGGEMGEETHTLTVDEIPPHTHPVKSTNADKDVSAGSYKVASTEANSTFDTNSGGGGSAHNNVQPTTFVNWLIRT